MGWRAEQSVALFFLLTSFTVYKFGEAQNICSVPETIIFIAENNEINDVVTTITADEGVVTSITSQDPAGLFSLDSSGLKLLANTVMDFEIFDEENLYVVNIECTKSGSLTKKLSLRIIITDVNDNPPSFAESQYSLEVDELTKVDTSVGLITATDPDKNDRLYYRLDSPEGEFDLEASFNPNILVKTILDFDKVKQITMTLYAQDTQIGSTAEVSHTASTTVIVHITDIDNRPPWFQPCTEIGFGSTKQCLSSGYEGSVKLNEQATEPLTLSPGPVLAIDGDIGRNDPIGYRFHRGEEDDIFEVNEDTGSITMLKPVTLANPITLTVMAYQKENLDQFSITAVNLKVVISSRFPPVFTKDSYEGFIAGDAGVDSLVLESKRSSKPLRVQATDQDFSDGFNPNLRFEIVDGTDFSITSEGFILLAKEVSPGTVDLKMRVVDTENDESSLASLVVEVMAGPPTTTMRTTSLVSSTIMPENTASTHLTDDTRITLPTYTKPPPTDATKPPPTDATKPPPTDATKPPPTDATTPPPTDATTPPPTDTTTPPPTDATSPPATYTAVHPSTEGLLGKTGGYSSSDMAALGASLTVFVILCLVCIGALAYRIKGNNAAWKKISEASIFRSTLGGASAGFKDGMQYINESFQNDDDDDDDDGDDSGSVNSKSEPEIEKKAELQPDQEQKLQKQTFISTSSSPPADSTGPAEDSEAIDGEKEVKPILTKERRSDDGYKSVWFKEDIDPDTKEEVLIIPDTREAETELDGEEDDEESEEEENMRTDLDDVDLEEDEKL